MHFVLRIQLETFANLLQRLARLAQLPILCPWHIYPATRLVLQLTEQVEGLDVVVLELGGARHVADRLTHLPHVLVALPAPHAQVAVAAGNLQKNDAPRA